MMNTRMALCVDEASLRNPELIGLAGELFDTQDWLKVFVTGEDARCGVVEDEGIAEAWVVCCDDVEPINLAASIKSDVPDKRVCLVTTDACGSLFSRAHTAQIDEVIEFGSFPRRYAEAKRVSVRSVVSHSDGETPDRQAAGEARALLAPASASGGAAVLEKPVVVPQEAHFLDLQPQSRPIVAAADSRAFVLTVVSGSGGAGKSSVSALSAVASHMRGYRTLLLDCDLQFGDVASMVGVESPLCLDEALLRPDRLEIDVVREGALSVIAAPSRLEASEEVVEHLPGLLERLMRMFEVIVVNTGASWAEQHAALLERSSAALFLVDQRASSVNACRHALELCARCGIAANPFQFALNRCMKGAPLTTMDVSAALQGASVFELKEGGRDVEDYLSAGGAADLIEMKNEFAKSVENVVDHLLPAKGDRPASRAFEIEQRRLPRRRNRLISRKHGEK